MKTLKSLALQLNTDNDETLLPSKNDGIIHWQMKASDNMLCAHKMCVCGQWSYPVGVSLQGSQHGHEEGLLEQGKQGTHQRLHSRQGPKMISRVTAREHIHHQNMEQSHLVIGYYGM